MKRERRTKTGPPFSVWGGERPFPFPRRDQGTSHRPSPSPGISESLHRRPSTFTRPDFRRSHRRHLPRECEISPNGVGGFFFLHDPHVSSLALASLPALGPSYHRKIKLAQQGRNYPPSKVRGGPITDKARESEPARSGSLKEIEGGKLRLHCTCLPPGQVRSGPPPGCSCPSAGKRCGVQVPNAKNTPLPHVNVDNETRSRDLELKLKLQLRRHHTINRARHNIQHVKV